MFRQKFRNSREFPPGIFEVADSREFPGIPEREFPAALPSPYAWASADELLKHCKQQILSTDIWSRNGKGVNLGEQLKGTV